jgi:hypothetical protein
VAKVLDMRDHVLPVEGLLLRVRKLLQFSIQVLEFCGQFLTPELQFTKGYDFCLIRIQQAFALPLYSALALQELFLLGGKRGKIVLFGLCPALVEMRQERRGF